MPYKKPCPYKPSLFPPFPPPFPLLFSNKHLRMLFRQRNNCFQDRLSSSFLRHYGGEDDGSLLFRGWHGGFGGQRMGLMEYRKVGKSCCECRVWGEIAVDEKFSPYFWDWMALG
jgi:hypothetical protein